MKCEEADKKQDATGLDDETIGAGAAHKAIDENNHWGLTHDFGHSKEENEQR